MLDRRRLAAYQALAIGPVWQARAESGADGHAAANLAPVTRSGHDSGTPVDVTRRSEDPDIEHRWGTLETQVDTCRACRLGAIRRNPVFGTGSRTARWMLIGEAPGAEEDRLGEPFVGRAGALLDAMLLACGLDRNRDVYIANVLKCRPPGNRDPEPDEVAHCEAHLREQVALLRPGLIVLLGRFAAQTLLRSEASVGTLRGRLHEVDVAGHRIAAIVSYHPAYLLRNSADKRLAWSDWCLARREMLRLAQSTTGIGER